MDLDTTMETPPGPRICSQSKCNAPASPDHGTCNKCRQKNTEARRASRAAKRARATESDRQEPNKRARASAATEPSNENPPEAEPDSDDDREEHLKVRTFL